MASAPAVTFSSAQLSPSGTYRYTLTRTLAPRLGSDPARIVVFVMLNPSTADHTLDDPTIRRCLGFADRQGCGELIVVNLSPFRATDPTELVGLTEPARVLERNTVAIRSAVRAAAGSGGLVVAAWGAQVSGRLAGLAGRVDEFAALLRRLRVEAVCLGVTQSGDPRHPLYVRGDAPLIPWPVTS